MNTITHMKNYIYYIVIALLIYFTIFLHLGNNTLRPWDESRTAANAIEMSFTSNYLYRTFEYKPENWETKPPLLIWLQVICLKTIGYNELAIRVPSALAGTFLLIFMVYYLNKKFKSKWYGLVFILLMLSSNGFLNIHNVRTGDHDSLLVMFEIFMLISFYEFIHHEKDRYLIFTFLFFTGAYFTKSVAVFPLLPAMFIYIIIEKKVHLLFKNKAFYIGILILIITISLYYFLVENHVPGYIHRALYEDLFCRYNKVSSAYYKGMYLQLLISDYFEWIYLFPFMFILFITSYKKQYDIITYFSLALFFIWISLPKGTPNNWYLAPIIPLVCVSITIIGCQYLIDYLAKYKYTNQILIGSSIILSIFVLPIKNNIVRNLSDDRSKNSYQYGYIIKQLKSTQPNIKNISMIDNESTHTSNYVYQEIYNKLYNYKIKREYGLDFITNNSDTVVTHLDFVKNEIENSNKYQFQKLLESRGCSIYSVKRK